MAIDNSGSNIISVNADGIVNSYSIVSSIFSIPPTMKFKNINSRIINNGNLATEHFIQQIMFYLLLIFAVIFLIYFIYNSFFTKEIYHHYNMFVIVVIILLIESINIIFIKKNYYVAKNIVDYTSNLDNEISLILNKNRQNNEPIILIEKDKIFYNIDLLKIEYSLKENENSCNIFFNDISLDLKKFNRIILDNIDNKIYGFNSDFLIIYKDTLVLLYYNNDIIIFDHVGKKYKILTAIGYIYINNPIKITYNNRNIKCINESNVINCKNLLENLWKYINPQGEEIIFNNI